MFVFRVIEKGSVPKELRRNYARWMKASLAAALSHWHRKYRPLHFGPPAYHRYPIYNLRERKDMKPLYATGETMRASEREDFRGTSKRMRAVYNLPKLNFKAAGRVTDKEGSRRGKPINLRAEYLAVNQQESDFLQKVVLQAFTDHVKLHRHLSQRAV